MNSNGTFTPTSSPSVSADAVSRRAYEIWENEGRPEGCDLKHWLQAEQELGSTPTRNDQANSSGRASDAGRNTDTRPLQGTRAAGAAARESKRSSASTAPFERAPSSGGAPGTKRR